MRNLLKEWWERKKQERSQERWQRYSNEEGRDQLLQLHEKGIELPIFTI